MIFEPISTYYKTNNQKLDLHQTMFEGRVLELRIAHKHLTAEPGDFISLDNTNQIQIKVKLIQLQLLLCKQTMNQPTNFNSSAYQELYGVMDGSTQVFYALESFEQFQVFMKWFQSQNLDTYAALKPKNTIQEVLMMNEEERRAEFEKSNQEIMGIFHDPLFNREVKEIKLQEVDF